MIDESLAIRSLFDNMLNGIAYCKMVYDKKGRPVNFIYVMVNTAFLKLTGLENVAGKKVTEVIPGIRKTNPELFEVYGRCATTGNPERFETYVEQLNIWFNISVYCPEKGYFAAVFENITENKKSKETKSRFDLLVKSSRDIILFLRKSDLRILDGNDAALREYGYSRDELLKLSLPDIRAESERELTAEQMEEADLHGIIFETVHRRKDGSIFPVEASSKGAEIGGVRTLINIIRDITERKKVEKELKETVRELQRSNMDLEQFAYVASHDLQEPLRMVSSYTQLLSEHYKGKLSPEADKFIHFAIEGARQMQDLINDLLSYSRINPQCGSITPNDCGQLLEKVKNNLSVLLEESGAVIESGNLPTLDYDAVQLSQVFQNIISNAVKFCGSVAPRIKISSVHKDSEWVFSIKDNGIGIDPKHFDKIFIIFKRLHTHEEYEGTGMGLAICKKIIESHGGRIWVESSVGKGSTFFFTVPDNLEDFYEQKRC